MQDKVVIVTGANAGLGFQITRKLSKMGAQVIMACRSPERAQRAHEQLMAELPEARATVLPLDVSKPDSIREFYTQFRDQFGQLDVLINNAGIVAIPLTRNDAGHELQLATNYLGPFALTGLLLPLIKDVAGAKIVNVGSLAHRFGRLTLNDFNWEKGEYNKWGAYARSKIAMVTYTLELNRRLQQQGSNIIALGAHPGFAATEIAKGDGSSLANPKNPIGKWFNSKMESLIPTAEQAAEPILLAACSDTVRGAEYFGPTGFLEIGGKPGKARINPRAFDQDNAQALWTLSESMTGVSYLSDNGTSDKTATEHNREPLTASQS